MEVRKSKYLCSRMKSRLAYLQDSHRESQQSDTFISKAEIKRLMDL